MAVGVGILYNSGDFAILYFALLAINVCLLFCMFHTLKVSVTCCYSISVPDSSVVRYHTAPRGVHRIFQRVFPKRGYACDMLCMRMCMVRASPVR